MMLVTCLDPLDPGTDYPAIVCTVLYAGDRLYAFQRWLGLPDWLGFMFPPTYPAEYNCLSLFNLFIFFLGFSILAPAIDLYEHAVQVRRGKLDKEERKKQLDLILSRTWRAFWSVLVSIWVMTLFVSFWLSIYFVLLPSTSCTVEHMTHTDAFLRYDAYSMSYVTTMVTFRANEPSLINTLARLCNAVRVTKHQKNINNSHDPTSNWMPLLSSYTSL